jgi:hypothetical protein
LDLYDWMKKLFSKTFFPSGTFRKMSKLNIALCQLFIGMDKDKNIQNSINKIIEASEKGAELIVLPVLSYF